MEKKPNMVSLNLTFKYKQGYSGVLVGQCVEVPSMIVQAETYQGLKDEMLKALEGYFKAFPDEREKVFAKYGNAVDQKTWNKEPLIYPIIN